MPPRLDDLHELREHFRRGDDLIAVHYACESLYTAKDHPPAVSCVGYCPIGRGNAGSFSIVDAPSATEAVVAETSVLSQYLGYLQRFSGAIFVHWNMSKAD